MKLVASFILPYCILFLLPLHGNSQKQRVSVTAGVNNSFKTPKKTPYATTADKASLMEVGLRYGRKLSNNFFFTTGLVYSPKGYNTGPYFTRRQNSIWPDYKYYEKRRFQFFEIPAGIQLFPINKKKYRIGLEGGLVNQFLTTVTHTPYDIKMDNPLPTIPGDPLPVKPEKQTFKSRKLDESGYRAYNIGLFLNVGAQYKFNSIGVGIIAFAKRSLLTSVKKESRYYESEGERFYSFGIGLNLSYDY
jgi:hypothetical protein